MSGERAAFRGARGPPRGRGDSGRGGRGDSSAHRGRGGSSGGGTQAQLQAGERPKKENILDLGKYMDKRITVKFSGGREGESICLFVSTQAGSKRHDTTRQDTPSWGGRA